jgi:hypothetical protein
MMLMLKEVESILDLIHDCDLSIDNVVKFLFNLNVIDRV